MDLSGRATQDAKAEEQLPSLHRVNELFTKFNTTKPNTAVFQLGIQQNAGRPAILMSALSRQYTAAPRGLL